MPHAEEWISEHGKDVEARGDNEACNQCHDTKQYCKTCHQVEMPHPKGFVSSHPGVTVEKGTDTCFNCHVVANCQACHGLHSAGDPQAHKLLRGTPFTLPATPAPSASPLAGGG
jgi:hypothetical protein